MGSAPRDSRPDLVSAAVPAAPLLAAAAPALAPALAVGRRRCLHSQPVQQAPRNYATGATGPRVMWRASNSLCFSAKAKLNVQTGVKVPSQLSHPVFFGACHWRRLRVIFRRDDA